MELQFTPSFFYGAAAAALMGLSLGVALHGPWESKAGGPRMMSASAAASELARPADEGGFIDASAYTAPTTDSYLYDGSLPADPLPVTRLKPDRYPNLWSTGASGVTQASADEGERVNPDDLYKADIFTDDELKSDSADEDLPPADQTPRTPMRYSALEAAESNPSF